MNVPHDPQPSEVEARPLLCAVEQSIEARGAAAVAASLAARLDAPLVLGHVLPDQPPFPHRSDAEVERHRRDSLEAAADLVERIASDSAPDCEPLVRLDFGDPCQKIIGFGEAEEARLLIVGSRGRSAVKAAIFGSVSRRLAARSPRPVLVVPRGAAGEFGLSLSERAPSVVCEVDGSDGAEPVRHAADLAAGLGMRLVLIHAYEHRGRFSGALPHHGAVAIEADRRLAREALHRAANLVGPDVEVSLRLATGDPAVALEDRAARECAAVIVTGSRGRGTLSSALLGSTSGRLAASAGRPVMVVSMDAGRGRAAGDDESRTHRAA